MNENASVVVRLKGGLGNQLFQYAAGVGLSMRNNIPLHIDSYSGFRNDIYQRQYQLAPFSLSAQVLPKHRCAELLAMSKPERTYSKLRERFRQYWFRRNFDASVFNRKVKSPVVLDGWWQSEKFFTDVTDIVRREFSLSVPLSKASQGVLKEIACAKMPVSVHIRTMQQFSAEGKLAVKRKPVILSAEYYRNALAYLRSVVGSVNVFVFSDNVENARKMRLPGSVTYLANDGQMGDYEDLHLISQCKHRIIANSTFSWWGAWLGAMSGIVCAPQDFAPFRDMPVPRDIYPAHWKIIR